METCVKVLILEEDIVDAWYIRDVLELSGLFKITGITHTSKEAFDLFSGQSPDLVISCIYLKNGDDAVEFIKKTREIKKVPVIYVSSHDDEETLNKALETSPALFITKPFTRKQLLVATQFVARKSGILNGRRNCLKPTHRELEIIRLLAKGESTKEIANNLCISYETVKSHRKNIYRKFSVSSGPETVAIAYQNNWIS